MLEIEQYTPERKREWDGLVDQSRQGTFLLRRDYMDYHSDRFLDSSLMFRDGDKLVGLLPANRVDDTLYSHQGLTYGGLITGNKATATEVIDMFGCLNSWCKANGVSHVVYKPIPWIYHRAPAEEDLYALVYNCHARLTVRNLSSAIFLSNPVHWRYGRTYDANHAERSGVSVACDDNAYDEFWPVLCSNLLSRHGTKPVHSVSEMKLLHNRFPDNIHLYVAHLGDEILGGAVLYVTPQVVHSQYIASTPHGKQLHAVDAVFRKVLKEDFLNYAVFDFGISNEDNGRLLNGGLIAQKEGFGGRGVVYDTYEWDI